MIQANGSKQFHQYLMTLPAVNLRGGKRTTITFQFNPVFKFLEFECWRHVWKLFAGRALTLREHCLKRLNIVKTLFYRNDFISDVRNPKKGHLMNLTDLLEYFQRNVFTWFWNSKGFKGFWLHSGGSQSCHETGHIVAFETFKLKDILETFRREH